MLLPLTINFNYMDKTEVLDIRDAFMEHLAKPEVDRDLVWLAKQTGLSYSHLYYIFVRKERDLTEDNRKKLNELLTTTI